MTAFHRLMTVLACLALLWAGGCSSLTTTHPLGVSDPALADRMAGSWVHEDHVIFIRHLGEGRLRLAGVEWKDDRFKLSELSALATRNNLVAYVNLKQEAEEGEPTTYSFMRVLTADEDHLVVVGPMIDRFKKAVRDGDLVGVVNESDRNVNVRITGDKADLDAFVEPRLVGEQFDLVSPLVLRRLRASE